MKFLLIACDEQILIFNKDLTNKFTPTIVLLL